MGKLQEIVHEYMNSDRFSQFVGCYRYVQVPLVLAGLGL